METKYAVVIGYWNAKVGTMKDENVAGLYGLGNWNEAGDKVQISATPIIFS